MTNHNQGDMPLPMSAEANRDRYISEKRFGMLPGMKGLRHGPGPIVLKR